MLSRNVSKETMVANLRALADRVETGTTLVGMSIEFESTTFEARKITDNPRSPDLAIYTVTEKLHARNQ